MLTRRQMLKAGLAGGGYALLGGGYVLLGPGRSRRVFADQLPSSPPTTPFLEELPIAPIAQPVARFATRPDPTNCVNVDGTTAIHVSGPRVVPTNAQFFLIHERQALHSFHPRLPPSSVWGYNGMVPGPTFLGRSGTPVLVRFVNDLPTNDPVGIGEPISAVHRHGGFQAPEDDGYPLDTFCTGQSRDYFYPQTPAPNVFGLPNPEQNEESTMWYHDHAIDITGPNVYRGLAGFFLNFDEVDSFLGEEDPNPRALRLPGRMRGQVREFDIPIVIQDKLFDQDGRLVFDTFDHNGFLGDKFVLNGKIQPFLRVKRRKYRFRFLNGSNARFYQLFLRNGGPFDFVIAADDHLFPRPLLNQKSIILGPAERAEVVIDFSRFPSNTEVILENRLEQDDGRKPDSLVSTGTPLLKFIVNGDVADPSRVPDTLRPILIGPAQILPFVTVKRTFDFERSDGAWQINGEFFDENRINAKPKVNTAEIWTIKSGGGWTHPVHIHLSSFFVLSRNGSSPLPLERARKDTIDVGAFFTQEVKILAMFPRYTGSYVFHCHNIEHEDMRMMAQFENQP